MTRNQKIKCVSVAAVLLSGVLLSALPTRSGQRVRAQAAPICTARSGRIVSTGVNSNVYGDRVAVTVYLPPCYSVKVASAYPVIYLLHGGGADETQWPDLNVQSAADRLIDQGKPPFVVVMPGATYSDHIDYSQFVVKDLLPGIASQFRVQTVRAGRGIGGISLGGYFALKTIFLHPDMFAAVGAFSPVVFRGYADDPVPLAQRAKKQTVQTLFIDLDVGNYDSLFYDTGTLDRDLKARGFRVAMTVGQGDHERSYWRTRTFDYFTFYLKVIAPI